MPLILAIEPDKRQASKITALARGTLRAELIVTESAEGALALLEERTPDLILMSMLLSPREETALADRLRELDAAGTRVDTLGIPVLGTPRRKTRKKDGGLLTRLRRTKDGNATPDGCDPEVFGNQITEYLERAAAERRQAADDLEDDFAIPAPVPAGPVAAEPAQPAPESIEPEFSVEAVTPESVAFESAVQEPVVFQSAAPDPVAFETAPAEPVPFETPALESVVFESAQPEPVEPEVAAQVIEPLIDPTPPVVELAGPEEAPVPAEIAAIDMPPVEAASAAPGPEPSDASPAPAKEWKRPTASFFDKFRSSSVTTLGLSAPPPADPAPIPESEIMDPAPVAAAPPEPREELETPAAEAAMPQAPDSIEINPGPIDLDRFVRELEATLLAAPALAANAGNHSPDAPGLPDPPGQPDAHHVSAQPVNVRRRRADEDPAIAEFVHALDELGAPLPIAPEPLDLADWEDIEALEASCAFEADGDLWMPLPAGMLLAWPRMEAPPTRVAMRLERASAAAAVAEPPPAPLRSEAAVPPPIAGPVPPPAPQPAPPRRKKQDQREKKQPELGTLLSSIRRDIEQLRPEVPKPEPPPKPAPAPIKPPVAAAKAPAVATPKTNGKDVQEPDESSESAASARERSKKNKKKNTPVQDEWGFFDPERAGFAALLSKLDEITSEDPPKRKRRS